MAIPVRGKQFTPAPEGMFDAVCVDVVDLGPQETQWGTKDKVRIVWEIRETMEDGRRFIVGKRYTKSLHEKATLHKDLRSWRGRAFTSAELEEFDVEAVLGAPCRLVIQHDEVDGSIFANVVSVLKADPKSRLTVSGTYIRQHDRDALGTDQARTSAAAASPDDTPWPSDSDAPPF